MLRTSAEIKHNFVATLNIAAKMALVNAPSRVKRLEISRGDSAIILGKYNLLYTIVTETLASVEELSKTED